MTQLQTGKYPLPSQLSLSKCYRNKILSREWFSNCGSRTDTASFDNQLSDNNKTERIRPVITLARFQKYPGSRLQAEIFELPSESRGIKK
jgi:hypothetical protein